MEQRIRRTILSNTLVTICRTVKAAPRAIQLFENQHVKLYGASDGKSPYQQSRSYRSCFVKL